MLCFHCSASLPASVRLMNHLRSLSRKYGVEALPVDDYDTQNVTVEYGLRLIGFDIDERKNLLVTSAWVRQVGLN